MIHLRPCQLVNLATPVLRPELGLRRLQPSLSACRGTKFLRDAFHQFAHIPQAIFAVCFVELLDGRSDFHSISSELQCWSRSDHQGGIPCPMRLSHSTIVINDEETHPIPVHLL